MDKRFKEDLLDMYSITMSFNTSMRLGPKLCQGAIPPLEKQSR